MLSAAGWRDRKVSFLPRLVWLAEGRATDEDPLFQYSSIPMQKLPR